MSRFQVLSPHGQYRYSIYTEDRSQVPHGQRSASDQTSSSGRRHRRSPITHVKGFGAERTLGQEALRMGGAEDVDLVVRGQRMLQATHRLRVDQETDMLA